MYKVYGMMTSGNCYKVRLLLAHLGEPYDWEEIPSTRVKPRTPEFLALTPMGKVPLLELPTGEHLPESGAILHYLAEGTPYLPDDKLDRARALAWMLFEQNGHEPYLAIARSISNNYPADHPRREELPSLLAKGNAALAVMEQHLARHDYFAGAAYSIADIALFAYTHVAGEGGFDLAAYPAVSRWLQRVRGQEGFVEL